MTSLVKLIFFQNNVRPKCVTCIISWICKRVFAPKAKQDIPNTKHIIIFIFLPRDNTFIFSLGSRKTLSNCRQWFKVLTAAHAASADLLKTSFANTAVTNVCVVVLWHHTLQVNVYKGQTWKHRLISFSLKDSLVFSHIICIAVAWAEQLMQR